MGSPKTPKSTHSENGQPPPPPKTKQKKPVKVTARSQRNSATSTLTSSVRHQPDVIAQVTSLTLPEQCPTAPVVVTRLPHPDDTMRSRSPPSQRSRQLSQSDGGVSEHLGFTAQVTPHYMQADDMQHGADSVYDSSEEEGDMEGEEEEGSEEYCYDDTQLTFQQQMPTHYHSLGSLVSNRSYHHHELSVAPPLQQNQYWV